MMENGNGHSESRLDRIEGIIEAVASRQADLEDEFSRLLKAQIVLNDEVNRSIKASNSRAELSEARMDRVEQNLAEAADKINALITLMDQHVREHRQGIH